MVKKRRIWKDAETYTSFPISFGCDDDEEQKSSVGDNGLEGDMNSNDMREFSYSINSSGTYLDEDGDEIPDLAAVCGSILDEEESVPTIENTDNDSEKDMNSNDKGCLPYGKNLSGTYIDDDGDEIPDLADVCGLVLDEEESVPTIENTDNDSEKDMNSNDKGCLPYGKNLSGTYIDDDGDEIPDLADVCGLVLDVEESVPTIGNTNNDSEEDMNSNDKGCLPYGKNLSGTYINEDSDAILELADFVGTRVAKVFENKLYLGNVTKYLAPIDHDDVPLWQIVYDDKDQEEWDMSELKNGATLFKSEVEFRSNDLINKSQGGTCGVDCKSDTSNECVDSDSENNMDEYFEYEDQPCDSDSDFCLSSGDESADHVSIVIDYYFIYRYLLISMFVLIGSFYDET